MTGRKEAPIAIGVTVILQVKKDHTPKEALHTPADQPQMIALKEASAMIQRARNGLIPKEAHLILIAQAAMSVQREAPIAIGATAIQAKKDPILKGALTANRPAKEDQPVIKAEKDQADVLLPIAAVSKRAESLPHSANPKIHPTTKNHTEPNAHPKRE